eukprot:scaffold3385_cov119-Isochrysis_galbana.AAC.2
MRQCGPGHSTILRRSKTKFRARTRLKERWRPDKLILHFAADGGRPEPGAGLKTSPAFQRRRELDAGVIARPRERLWHSLAWPCALADTAGTGLGQWPELAALDKGKVCCKDLAKTLMSAAASPFTTTASAVHYNPLRRIKPTLEQFVAFKRSLPKKLEPRTSYA